VGHMAAASAKSPPVFCGRRGILTKPVMASPECTVRPIERFNLSHPFFEFAESGFAEHKDFVSRLG
jgi:hypothetical protein